MVLKDWGQKEIAPAHSLCSVRRLQGLIVTSIKRTRNHAPRRVTCSEVNSSFFLLSPGLRSVSGDTLKGLIS